ncbi:hypothetical protein FRB98_000608 [Tulasnella sp. 332]|nr:hypothetical protein FRB98_000608 [Tulasnella sp. 332]
MSLSQPPLLPLHHQHQHHHGRQLSMLNTMPGGMPQGHSDMQPMFTPQYPQFPLVTPGGNGGPQSGFAFPPVNQHPMQQQQRQLGHSSHPSMAMPISQHRSRPSLANIPGFMPGLGLPTPLTAGPHSTHFPPQTPGGTQQNFPVGQSGGGRPQNYRQKRQQSISIGGPPKALLGGPQKKPITPIPGVAPVVINSSNSDVKLKKVVVKLPKESESDGTMGDDVAESSSQAKSRWTRHPIPQQSVPSMPPVEPPVLVSRDVYSDEDSDLSEKVTVILPRRNAWDLYRSRTMEEKLAKLGVKPSGLPVMPPHLTAHLHNRASSISTPADPALFGGRRGSLPLGLRQTPSPNMPISHPLSASTTANSSQPQSHQNTNSLAPPFGQNGSISPLPQRFNPAGSLSSRGSMHHGHTMSLASTSFAQPNPYLGNFAFGSTNPFGSQATLGDGSGGASLSVSPQPGTSLASVSEFDEEGDGEEEEEGTGSSAAGGLRIHAPQPRGMLQIRPVFVSHQTSPASSSIPELRERDTEGLTPPPMTAVGLSTSQSHPPTAAKDLSRPDFMRGFGIETDIEDSGSPGDDDEIIEALVPEVQPIVDEVCRENIIAAEIDSGPTPTAAHFSSEDNVSKRSHHAVDNTTDLADDADDEVAEDGFPESETEQEDERESAADDEESHSRHVSKVSMAPSLAELGPGAGGRGFRDFKFGGGRENGPKEANNEERFDDAEQHLVDLNHEYPKMNSIQHGWTNFEDEAVSEDDSIGEWSNPSDEERARQNKLQSRQRRAEVQSQIRRSRGGSDGYRLPTGSGDSQSQTLHSQRSFVSNPSNEHLHSDYLNSNPSDDEVEYGRELEQPSFPLPQAHGGYQIASGPISDLNSTGVRPLPPLPHSRQGSHDHHHQSTDGSSMPYHHSPALSNHTATPVMRGHHAMSSATSATKITDLNPLAKPFVFGARPGSMSFLLQSPATDAGSLTQSTSQHGSHSRQLSLASRLNIAAPEFKPTGAFAFKALQGLPTIPQPAPTANTESRPLPQPPTNANSQAYAVQGREKHPRLGTVDDEEPATFQFPHPESPPGEMDAETEQELGVVPSYERPGPVLNVHAEAFTFQGLSVKSASEVNGRFSDHQQHNKGLTRSENASPVHLTMPQLEASNKAVSMPTSAINSPSADYRALSAVESSNHERFITPQMPMPECNHPVSTTKVRAGLFKALTLGDPDSPTRAAVRSRLGSRDLTDRAARRSLDDLNVASISKAMATKPPGPSMPLPSPVPKIAMPEPAAPSLALAPPPRGKDRRSAAPSQGVDTAQPSPGMLSESMFYSASSRPDDLEHLESRMEEILEDKMSQLRGDLLDMASAKTKESDGVVNMAIGQLVSSFRAQMLDYMKKVTESSVNRVDAHVELDFNLIKAAIDEGHQALHAAVISDLVSTMQKLQQTPPPRTPIEVLNAIDDLRDMVSESVEAATHTMITHMDVVDSHARQRPDDLRQLLVQDIASHLLPRISALRPEPIDVNAMTRQLSEAVKPHISQLIDITSDKKETASLIVQQLSPVLQSLVPPRLDLAVIAHQLAEDVVRLAPPTDPHLLKEEVADLVVARLDARLSIRDSSFSPDAIVGQVVSAITPLTDLTELPSKEAVATLHQRQDLVISQGAGLLEQQTEVVDRLANLSPTLLAATDVLKALGEDLVSKAKVLEDLEELRRLAIVNADLQTQLGKARGAHGQVRSEKDVLSERLQTVETERQRLQTDLDKERDAQRLRDEEMQQLERRCLDSEADLARAVDDLKSVQVSDQAQQVRIGALELHNQEMLEQSKRFENQIKSLELEASFAARDLSIALDKTAQVERERDALQAQTHHWDDIRRTAEQVEALSRLIGAADSEELQELRRIRDHSTVLEREHASLQKRCADQEAKIAAQQRTSAQTKQTMAVSQQKLSEWEKRARTAEGDLAESHALLEQAGQSQRQTDARLADLERDNTAKAETIKSSEDREQRLRDQVAALERQLSAAKSDLRDASRPATIHAPRPEAAAVRSWQQGVTGTPDRPTSTASPISRSGTATPKNGSTGSPDTPPANGLWQSIHAPQKPTASLVNPQKSYHSVRSYSRPSIPSPTPSTVSIAATEQEDGWWS